MLALGEARAGERINDGHLRRLEDARIALGERATGAKLLLFGTTFAPSLVAAAGQRPDVEIVNLQRLYGVD